MLRTTYVAIALLGATSSACVTPYWVGRTSLAEASRAPDAQTQIALRAEPARGPGRPVYLRYSELTRIVDDDRGARVHVEVYSTRANRAVGLVLIGLGIATVATGIGLIASGLTDSPATGPDVHGYTVGIPLGLVGLGLVVPGILVARVGNQALLPTGMPGVRYIPPPGSDAPDDRPAPADAVPLRADPVPVPVPVDPNAEPAPAPLTAPAP